MEILSLKEAPKVPFNLNGRILCNHQNVQIVHLTLKAGDKIEKHINENDVLFYVLEGKALIIQGNEHHLVSKDEIIKIQGGTERGFDNISVADFKVMVIKFLPLN